MKTNNINETIDTYKDTSYEQFKSYERFQFLLEEMSPALQKAESFLDIGCAKGEYIYLTKKKHPDIHYCGLEYSEELIALAHNEPFLKDVTFVQGDARDFHLDKTFDVCLMSGVLSIFDEIESPLDMMLKHIKKGGWGYIFGGFTSADIDVLVRFRDNKSGFTRWQSGWNMFSLNTVQKKLEPYVDTINCNRFTLSIDLPKTGYPEKSYTLNTREQGRIIVTGGNIIREMYLLAFQKKS